MDWTPAELQVLRDKYEKVSWTEIKSLLRNHTRTAITRKAGSLGLNRRDFSLSDGKYILVYALCHRHGRVLKKDLIRKGNASCCPYCGERVRLIPRTNRMGYKAAMKHELVE